MAAQRISQTRFFLPVSRVQPSRGEIFVTVKVMGLLSGREAQVYGSRTITLLSWPGSPKAEHKYTIVIERVDLTDDLLSVNPGDSFTVKVRFAIEGIGRVRIEGLKPCHIVFKQTP